MLVDITSTADNKHILKTIPFNAIEYTITCVASIEQKLISLSNYIKLHHPFTLLDYC